MSRFGTQYHVARPTGQCAVTEVAFNPGDEYIATLSDRLEDEGFDRQDYSLDAWGSGARPDRLFSHWRFRRPGARRQANPHARGRPGAAGSLRTARDDDRSHRVAFRFVLALILMRKRYLKFVGRAGEGDQERWLMTLRGSSPDQAAPRGRQSPSL